MFWFLFKMKNVFWCLFTCVLMSHVFTINIRCPNTDMKCPELKRCCLIDGKHSCCNPDDEQDLPDKRIEEMSEAEMIHLASFANSSFVFNESDPQNGIICDLVCSGKCCGDNCCPDYSTCCDNGGCCPFRGTCCDDGCCKRGQTCCGSYCCKEFYTCCGGYCCRHYKGKCCKDRCCRSQDTCCGDTCCSVGQTCCGSWCCGSRSKCGTEYQTCESTEQKDKNGKGTAAKQRSPAMNVLLLAAVNFFLAQHL